MKIKLFSNYDLSADLAARFKDNYPINDNLIQIITIGDDYDVAVVFNKTYDTIKPGAKIVTFIQEPSWSPCHDDNNFLTDSDYLFVHDKNLFEETLNLKLGGQVYEEPSYMWFHDHIPYYIFNLMGETKPLQASFIVSAINASIGNYGKRLALVDKILESDLDIHIYGKGLKIEDPRYKGEVLYKHTALSNYQYSIAIENSCEKNYITEKFIDPILCDAKPIYLGAPNINDVYNEKGFDIIDLDEPNIIETLREIISKPVDLDILEENRLIYFEKYNLYERLKTLLL